MSQLSHAAARAARNCTDMPNRFVIRDLMSLVGPQLGLKAPVLHTLDVLLSFLPPTRDHHMVFAANARILERAQGLSERSLRRHIQLLQEAGLLARQSSANGKRFARRSSQAVLHFGLDLGPLIARLEMIREMADSLRAEAQHNALLRQEIRALCQRRLKADPADELAQDILRQLRRKLVQDDLLALRDSLEGALSLPVETPVLTASDGQIDRHHKSEIKDITIEKTEIMVDIAMLHQACPEVAKLSSEPITTWDEANRFAQKMHLGIGISQNLFEKAKTQVSPEALSIVIWSMLQRFDKIRNAPAYFAALTCGPAKTRLDPLQWFKRLSADNAPRPRLKRAAIPAMV